MDDEQVQPYLRYGRPFDESRPSIGPNFHTSAQIANAMLPYLPKPKTVEIQHKIEIPSPSGKDFTYLGYADIWARDGSLLGLPPGNPCVADTKTTSDINKWALTEKTLATNVQAMLYATAAMFETGARTIDLAWIYGQTKGAKKAKRVHLRAASSHVAEQFEAIDATAVELFALRESVVKALDLPPNPDACEMYGGCPYRDKCNLSPAQIVDSYAAKAARLMPISKQEISMGSSTADMLASLKARRTMQTATAGTANAAPEASAAEPDAIPQEAPAWLQEKTPYEGRYVVEGIRSRQPPLGINPPESKLPYEEPSLNNGPQPPGEASNQIVASKKRGRPRKNVDQPPVAVAESPAAVPEQPDTGASAPPVEAAEVIGQRHSGVLMSAKEAAVVPVHNVGDMFMSNTITVTYGQETFTPVPYQSCVIGPFSHTVEVEDGETLSSAYSRVYAELSAFAEQVRRQKLASFAAALGCVK